MTSALLPTLSTRAELHFASATCALGFLHVAGSARGLCAVFFSDARQDATELLQSRFPRANLSHDPAMVTVMLNSVLELIARPTVIFQPKLDWSLIGTVFQQRVWAALRRVPIGKTITYTALAAQLEQPTAVRAVANACGANPLAVVVPCHRVVRRDGSLGGYHWGLARKRQLLDAELAAQTG